MKFRSPLRWTFRPDCPTEALALQKEAGLPELAARILANRAIGGAKEARDFIDAPLRDIRDPFDLPDMDRAASRVARAITRNEPVTVYGDYDVDGISATAVLIGLFRFLGVEAGYYVPHRVEEGYGLNRMAIDKLAARGTKLIVTVDNGVTANDEIAYAASLGVEVVVTDHHEQGDALPAAACAIVDPKRLDRPYTLTEFCGTGVAWKLAHAVLREMETPSERGREFLKAQMDLVALATVADMVPLVGENRNLARAGIGAMRDTARMGLRALMEVAGLNGAVTARDMSFLLAPRLNAVGRTRSAVLGVQLMLSTDPEEARALAGQMNTLNNERREQEKRMMVEALEEYGRLTAEQTRRVIVVARENWHPGFVGLVASRLCDLHYRPVFVISVDPKRDMAKGSARSIDGFNLNDALRSFFGPSESFGGHAMAAGFHLPASRVGGFREAMVAYAERRLSDEQLRPGILIDAEAPLASLTLEAAEAIETFQPFGEGNPRPIVSFSDVSLADTPRVVGNNHLRLKLYQSGFYVSAIGWGMGDLDSRLLRHNDSISVAGHPTVNDYQGRRTPEIELCDIRFE